MKKTITFELNSITVEIEGSDNLLENEVLELGKKAVVKQLSKEFPFYHYSITDGAIIKAEDIKIGRPIKMKDTEEVGIIYEVKPNTKFPIRVLINGNKEIQVKQSVIERLSKKNHIEKLIKGRADWEKKSGDWIGVRTAFFVNGHKVIPVIVNANGRGKIKAIIVGHEVTGSFYSLSSLDSKRLFDTKKEAEEYLRKTA